MIWHWMVWYGMVWYGMVWGPGPITLCHALERSRSTVLWTMLGWRLVWKGSDIASSTASSVCQYCIPVVSAVWSLIYVFLDDALPRWNRGVFLRLQQFPDNWNSNEDVSDKYFWALLTKGGIRGGRLYIYTCTYIYMCVLGMISGILRQTRLVGLESGQPH